MLKPALQEIKTAIALLLFLIVLTGIVYPLLVTLCAQLLFPWQANGSLLVKEGKPVGSMLIGQFFSSPQYFFGRPSMTPFVPYNGASSSGSNRGPSNKVLLSNIAKRIDYLKAMDLDNKHLIPVDLVTASGSGLDPEISPLAAMYQASRIAKARHVTKDVIEALIDEQIKQRSLGFLGEPRVNVLQLNLALDEQHGANTQKP